MSRPHECVGAFIGSLGRPRVIEALPNGSGNG
jgi:hypothetical protein